MAPETLEALFARLEARGLEDLEREGVAPERRAVIRTADLRYFAQTFELTVSAPSRIGSREELAELGRRFHEAYAQTYGYASPTDPVQLLGVRVTALGRTVRPVSPELPEGGPTPRRP